MSKQRYPLPHERGFMDFINETFYSAEKGDDGSGLFPFQRFVPKYINQATPYRGILLFYGLGAGKTRTAIAACESFLKARKDIVVITPASLQQNFKIEYTASPPPALAANPEAGLRERFTFLNYNGGNSFARSTASDRMGSFDSIDLDNKLLIIDEVHNLVSIMVNAMRTKRYRGMSIYRKIMSAKNLRIIALSGTPIINFPYEIAVLMNILAGYMNLDNTPWTGAAGAPRLTLFPESEEEFNSTYLDTSNSKSFQVRPEATSSFCDRLVGYVSYYAGLTGKDVYPELIMAPLQKVEMSNYQFSAYVAQRTFEIEETQRVIKSEQYSSTSGKSKELDMNLLEKKSSFRASTREVCNFAFPEAIPRTWRRDVRALVMSQIEDSKVDDPSLISMEQDLTDAQLEEVIESKQAIKKRIDDMYHNELEKKLGKLFAHQDVYLTPHPRDEAPVVDMSLQAFKAKDESAASEAASAESTVTDCLDIYSPKMLKMLQNIIGIRGVEERDGLIVVYSYFNKVEGVNIFQHVLQAAGYEQYVLERHADRPKAIGAPGRFCFWEGDQREQLLKHFNDKRNKRGQIIKILLITEAGAEGITLKNVRQLHVMEPYWNEVLIRQVIGRAKRIHSHLALPEAERDVTVFRYETTFTREQKEYISRQLGWDLDEQYTTDQIISLIAQRKQFATDQIEEFMKETAVDCFLNIKDNNRHRLEDHLKPLVCYHVRDVAAASASASASAAASASRFSLSADATEVTQTSRFGMASVKKEVIKFNNVVIEGLRTEYVFVRGIVEKEGKKLGVIDIYLADKEWEIGVEKFLIARLYIGPEKDRRITLLSTKGEIGSPSATKVKYVLDLNSEVPMIRKA